MINLDNLEEIRKFDPKNVFGSTELFVKQCRQIHEQIEGMEFEPNLKNAKNIIFSGMGGSAYGGHVAIALFRDELLIPAYLNSDYGLPLFADCDSLVLLTSYSGTTEETLSTFDEAKTRNAYMIGLTSGGTLEEYYKDGNLDAVVFNPKYNPSGQPRLGTGYIVLGTVEILQKLGFVQLASEDIATAIDQVESIQERAMREAKLLAQKVYGQIPVIFAASHLSGNAHIMRNQFNETAKSFASYHIVSEANHHVLEGLKNPPDRRLVSIFLDSTDYSPILNKRMELTKEVVQNNSVDALSYSVGSKTKLSQALELLLFGGYLTFYLAILYKQDPSVIPWVDFFKEKLKA